MPPKIKLAQGGDAATLAQGLGDVDLVEDETKRGGYVFRG